MKKLVWIILGIVLVLVIVGGIYYYQNYYPYSGNAGQITERDLYCGSYYGQYNQKKIGTPDNWIHGLEGTKSALWHTPDNWQNPMSCDYQNNQNVSDETAGWKTYTNSEYGFEFKYPLGLYVHDSPYYIEGIERGGWFFISQEPTPPKISMDDVCGSSKDYLSVTADGNYKNVYIWSKYDSVEALVRGLEYDFDSGKKIYDKTVNGARIVKFVGGIYSNHFYLINGVNIYSVIYQTCAGGFMPVDQIVSTFKFIN